MTKRYLFSLIFLGMLSQIHAQGIQWESLGYASGAALPRTVVTSAGPQVVTVDWTTVTDGGSFVPHEAHADFVIYDANELGTLFGNLALGFDNSSDDPDDYIELNIYFSIPVTNVEFTLMDIDFGNWDDGVDVLFNGSVNPVSDPAMYTIANASYVAVDNEVQFDGFEAFNNVPPVPNNSTDGNVTIRSNNLAVSSIRIRYRCTDDLGGRRPNPSSQRLGLSDITWACESDFDGDLICDFEDLDDDNDGILDTDELNNCQATDPLLRSDLFNEDFGTGARTPMIYTNYGYEPGPMTDNNTSVNDGEYAVLDDIQSSAQWASTVWQNIGDHTSGSGRMALFNSNNTAGLEFYRRPIGAVDPNGRVGISFWIMNLDIIGSGNGRVRPNVTVNFEQNGSVVASYDTGDIAQYARGDQDAWEFKEFSFLPPTGDPITIVMINNAPGGSGNDLAIDDIIAFQEYCDTDDDGIANHNDLDADGDGCLDTFEAQVNDPDEDGLAGSGAPTVNGQGQVNGITYVSPATTYWLSDVYNFCIMCRTAYTNPHIRYNSY